MRDTISQNKNYELSENVLLYLLFSFVNKFHFIFPQKKKIILFVVLARFLECAP